MENKAKLENIKKLREELKEELNKIKALLERILSEQGRLPLIRLETLNWLDDYNGKKPTITVCRGIRIADWDFEKRIGELLRVVYKPEETIDYRVYATVEYGIVIQCCEKVHNEYGEYLGTEKWWVTLDELVKRALLKRATGQG